MKLHIKNMVCQRCIMAVEHTLKSLDIPYQDVSLGDITLKQIDLTPNTPQYQALANRLNTLGFEILTNKQGRIIETIKQICLQTINLGTKHKLSKLISDELHADYSHLSQMFSSVEGETIEQYFITLRIEKIKELLVYDEKTLAEIAFNLGFSSVAHLSSQFKKVTGMTPSYFRSLKNTQSRRQLDKL